MTKRFPGRSAARKRMVKRPPRPSWHLALSGGLVLAAIVVLLYAQWRERPQEPIPPEPPSLPAAPAPDAVALADTLYEAAETVLDELGIDADLIRKTRTEAGLDRIEVRVPVDLPLPVVNLHLTRFVEARGCVSRSQLLVRAGDADGAMAALRRASVLNRADPLLHEVLRVSRLAVAARFVGEQRYAAAEEIYRRVLSIDARQPEAHYGLAFALEAQGKPVAAMEHYTRAIEGAPRNPDYHAALAGAAFRIKRHRRAIAHFRCALELRPDWPEALHNLVWALLAGAREGAAGPGEAVAPAERACELTGWRDAKMVDALQYAYAAAGRRQDAADVAQRALIRAEKDGDTARAEKLREDLRRYGPRE